MDEKDTQILNWLASKGRMPTTQLAKKVNIPKHVAIYRRKKLESSIITSYIATLNYEALELHEYIILLRLNNFYNQKEELKDFFSTIPNILWAGEMYPKYNLRITCIAKSHDDFEKILGTIEEKLHDSIQSLVYTKLIKLIKSEPYTTIYTKKETPKAISTLDKKIISFLCEEPLISLASLATKANTNIETARLHTKNLLEGTLHNISVNINNELIGLPFSVTLLTRVSNYAKVESKLIQYLYSSHHLGRSRHVFGDWNVEINVAVQSHKQLGEILKELEQVCDQQIEILDIQIPIEKIFNGNISEIIKKELILQQK